MVSKRLPEVLHDFVELVDCTFAQETSPEADFPKKSTYDLGTEPVCSVDERKAAILPRNVYEALRVRIASDPRLHGASTYRTIYEVSEGHIVLNPTAESLNHIEHRGVRYCTHAYYAGDSHVLFRPYSYPSGTQGSEANSLSLGRIHMIFVHKRLQADGNYRHQVFVALRTFTALSEQDQPGDPYRRHSASRATLVYSSPSPALRVVPICDIVAQFVVCPYREVATPALSRRCIVAIPWEEVCDKQRLRDSRD